MFWNHTQRYFWRTVTLMAASVAMVMGPEQASGEELRAGKSFLPTQVYSQEQDEATLELFAGLRVADVSDGMDRAGLKNVGLVSPDIGPLWRDLEHFRHRFVGIAVTVRYVPTNRPHVVHDTDESHQAWVGQWYSKYSPEPFVPLIRDGTVLVIDDAQDADVGSIGSNNILLWKKHGCVAVVTDATARDTDEIAVQQIPLYYRGVGRGIRPGRNEVESVNRPVVIGGVTVMPGDVVVGDGDGLIVVPREQAELVARFSRRELDVDKAGRQRLYQELGLPEDDSVR
jgi:4-hydroxy-4-methyl-2-oxoglutarate aldolase